jgi:S-adenosyl methyltransferase
VRVRGRLRVAYLATAWSMSGPAASILGHVTDTGGARLIVRSLMNPLPSGSYPSLNDGISVIADQAYWQPQRAITKVARFRTSCAPEEIASFLDGLELVEPGVVACPR